MDLGQTVRALGYEAVPGEVDRLSNGSRLFERPKAIIAIPLKDEEACVAPCLAAFSAQRAAPGAPLPPFEIVLFINNSSDGSALIAQGLKSSLPFHLVIIEGNLPREDANAGGARRYAMNYAARRLSNFGNGGILLTTDADSVVAPDWISRNAAAIARGADAVAGAISLNAYDEEALPPELKARGALEARYEALVCELEARLCPEPHDPLPRHATESGASFAVTIEAFLAAGGIPRIPLGEDKAFARALQKAGFKLRHDPAVKVSTSGRLAGRAAGGCADTMRMRIENPHAPCDLYLRPVASVLHDTLMAKLKTGGHLIERTGRPLQPHELPRQIQLAGRWLILLQRLAHRHEPLSQPSIPIPEIPA